MGGDATMCDNLASFTFLFCLKRIPGIMAFCSAPAFMPKLFCLFVETILISEKNLLNRRKFAIENRMIRAFCLPFWIVKIIFIPFFLFEKKF
jgi:hypothetical protein